MLLFMYLENDSILIYFLMHNGNSEFKHIPLFLQAMVQDFQKALFWLLSANFAALVNCISKSKTQV